MSTRCACGTGLDDSPEHDTQFCADLQADIRAAADHAKGLKIPADRAARIAGSLACEIPAPARQAAVLAALDAWAGAS